MLQILLTSDHLVLYKQLICKLASYYVICWYKLFNNTLLLNFEHLLCLGILYFLCDLLGISYNINDRGRMTKITLPPPVKNYFFGLNLVLMLLINI